MEQPGHESNSPSGRARPCSSLALTAITIRNLDDAVEKEERQILLQVVKPADMAATSEGLGSRIHNHFAQLGGAELELPSRSDTPAAPDLVNDKTAASTDTDSNALA